MTNVAGSGSAGSEFPSNVPAVTDDKKVDRIPSDVNYAF